MNKIRQIIKESIVIAKGKVFRFLDAYNNKKYLHTHSLRTMTKYWADPQELNIPTSYGFIAAKVWGNKDDEPVLALHGWQDNAGTFDRLIPLLSSKLYIVAIDAPGHGLSSHKPIGTFYHYLEMLVDIKRVVDFLKWDKFSFLGHSLGGTLALLYCSIFPQAIKNIVLLDVGKPASRDANLLPSATQKGIINLLEIEKKMSNSTPVYSLEEARERLRRGLYNQVNPESLDFLLKRGCRPSDCGKGVVFTRDIRVKMTEDLHKFSHDDLKVFMSKIMCNLLIIHGKNSLFFKSRTPEVFDDFLDIYRKNCKSCQLVAIEGNHFVHLNNPELVAPYIDTFFKFQGNELSSKM